jgi:hypothetical protein
VELRELLRVLCLHRVDFVVVGGVAAALGGAAVTTFDLDIVYERSDQNIARLVQALRALDAFYREHPENRIRPHAELLHGRGHHLLQTRAGALDLLGELGQGEGYEFLIGHADIVDIGEQLAVRVLRLETLIEIKTRLGREKDLAVIPLLRRTLEERRRKG